MLASFKQVQDKRGQYESMIRITRLAYSQRWCSTCKHCILTEYEVSAGVTDVMSECDFGGLADETCERYECDCKEYETLQKYQKAINDLKEGKR